jgi:AcrR family transcriptional regulator
MVTRKVDTRVRQEQIVQAALALVAAHGLERLSVARVARRVGVVPSALYRHFPGKEAIVDAVLSSVRQRLEEAARLARDEAPDAAGRLKALLARHIATVAGNPGALRLVFADETCPVTPKRRAILHATVRGYLDAVAGLVREGQENGEMDRAVEPESAAILFLALAQPPPILSQPAGGKADVEGRAETAWRLFERALGSTRPAHPPRDRYVNVDSLLL